MKQSRKNKTTSLFNLFDDHCFQVPEVLHNCFYNCQMYYDDLLQEGYIGLYEATKKYNPSREVPFSAFAGVYIKGYMRNFIKRYKDTRQVEIEDHHERKLHDMYDPLLQGEDVFPALNDRQKYILYLSFMQPKPTEEDLAVLLGTSQWNISKQRKIIKRKLHEIHIAIRY